MKHTLTQAQQDELYTTSVAADFALRFKLARKNIVKWNPKPEEALTSEFDANDILDITKADQFTRRII